MSFHVLKFTSSDTKSATIISSIVIPIVIRVILQPYLFAMQLRTLVRALQSEVIDGGIVSILH